MHIRVEQACGDDTIDAKEVARKGILECFSAARVRLPNSHSCLFFFFFITLKPRVE